MIKVTGGADSFRILETQDAPYVSVAQSQSTAETGAFRGARQLWKEVEKLTIAAESFGLHKCTYTGHTEGAKITG